MGTRVYPTTKNPESLEKLAGVPAGTYARLMELEAKEKEETAGLSVFDADPIHYNYYCLKHDDPHLGQLDQFILYGWGRLRDDFDILDQFPEFWDEEKEGDYAGRKFLTPSGSPKSIEATKALADTMRIPMATLALAEGLYWC